MSETPTPAESLATSIRYNSNTAALQSIAASLIHISESLRAQALGGILDPKDRERLTTSEAIRHNHGQSGRATP